MLRSTIQTTDSKTGAELPIPADLRQKVLRADTILQTILQGVGKRFDINIRWYFEGKPGNDFNVFLSLSTATGHQVLPHPLPHSAFDSPEALRRALSSTLWMFGDILSAELEHELEGIRRNLQDLATVGEV